MQGPINKIKNKNKTKPPEHREGKFRWLYRDMIQGMGFRVTQS